MPGELLLVGSIPTETTEQAFRQVGAPLGQWLDYMPDGEVGERGYWVIRLAYRFFHGHPDIETIQRPAPRDGVETWKQSSLDDAFLFRVRDGVDRVRFGDPGWRMGYTHDAVNSYSIFRLLKEQGAIPAHVRFQVSIPATYSCMGFAFPDPEDTDKVAPGVTEALRAEIGKMLELIPHDDLAIQWDLAFEHTFTMRKMAEDPAAAAAEAARQMAPIGEIPIPETVALGHHACFGTANGWPSRRPDDLAPAVLLMNAAVAAAGRRSDFVHIPTIDIADDAFFAPLADLEVGDARVYFGAIHHLHDDATGLRPQLETLKKYVPDFGLAAPCGWGRVMDRGKTDHMLAKPGQKLDDPLGVIVGDHIAAVETLQDVLAS